MSFIETPITRNKYSYFDCLAQTLHPTKSETFKVEILDYQTMKDDHGYVQIGEITFSLNDVLQVIHLSSFKTPPQGAVISEERATDFASKMRNGVNSGEYTINAKIIHKTAYSKNIPYSSSNITLPANLKLIFHYNNPKYNSNISLYDSDTNQIVSASVDLVRTTGQLVSSGISKLSGKCCQTSCEYSVDNPVIISE
jgi:hypothetical protein